MKFLLTSLLAIFLFHNSILSRVSAQELHPTSSSLSSNAIPWADSYAQAIEQAKRTNQSIVLFFTGSDWCHWCKVLESEQLSDPTFARLLRGEFLFVRLDFPRSYTLPSHVAEQNAALRKRYNVTGFPTLVILNAEGRVLGRTGYHKIPLARFAAQLQAIRQ